MAYRYSYLKMESIVNFSGREIREGLDEHVAQLYADLDGGLSHLAWLLPTWVPLPSFKWVSKLTLTMYITFVMQSLTLLANS